MAGIDYRILDQGKRPMQGIGIGQGVQEGMQQGYMDRLKNTVSDQFASGAPDMNAMLSGLGRVDPVKAMSMQNANNNRGAKSSVFAMKQKAGQTPEAKAIMSEYASLSQQASDMRAENPKANIAPILNKMGLLESNYKALTGVPMANKITGKTINTMAKERMLTEKGEDDLYDTSEKITSRLLTETDKALSEYRTGASSMRKALDLMQGDPETINQNPTQIASAIKMYVRALDNSVVNAGEIKSAVGGDAYDSIVGFANGLINGVSYSKDQLDNFYKSMVAVAETSDAILDSHLEGLGAELDSSFKNAVETGRVPQDRVGKLSTNIKDMLKNRTGKYRVMDNVSSATPLFDDILSEAKTPKATTNYQDPFGDLD